MTEKEKQHEKDVRQAKALFARWFAKYPTVPNPTDINSRAKFNFAVEIGYDNLSLMLRFRKSNVKRTGYPYPWTQAEYWLEVFSDEN